MSLWIALALCAAVIVYCGSRLSTYGDIIAEKTGMGGTWIGLVLMAAVTSLPELITGISAVTYAEVPDIAAGDIFGSCVFNLLILAVLDASYRKGPISTRAHHGHVLAGGVGILLLSTACLSLFLKDRLAPLGWIGPYSLLFILIYLAAMRLIYVYERRQFLAFVTEQAMEPKYRDTTMTRAAALYGINALVVVAAAVFLPGIGEGIAEITGLGQTFVGTLFIALATSLPEIVVSLAAVRMDAVNLAIGNLFGSNIFNIFILAIDDIFFVQGPLLSFVSPAHIVSILSAIAMTTIAIIGLTYRAEKKRFLIAWDSLAIAVVYAVNVMILYMLR